MSLFGGEISSNAADYFAAGLKGRHNEQKKYGDHHSIDQVYRMPVVADGRLVTTEVPLRTALNELLRDEYIADCERACARWNRTIGDVGLDYRLQIPSRRFNRSIGIYADHHFDPDGSLLTEAQWNERKDEWLPTAADREHVRSVMQPVREPGRFASWLAPPAKGIKGKPLDFEYVKLCGCPHP